MFAVLLALATVLQARGVAGAADRGLPPIVTEDIPRFWRAFDRIVPGTSDEEAAAIFAEEYFGRASAGLLAFVAARPEVRRDLAAVVRSHRGYYESIRQTTLSLDAPVAAVRTALERMKRLYPPARFPPVYLLIGVLSTGGTQTSTGLLIGTELFARTPKSPLGGLSRWLKDNLRGPDALPGIVVHELIHALQRMPMQRSLLSAAIAEGMADFLAELVLGQALDSPYMTYGALHEAVLWREFQQRMGGRSVTGWLYDGDRSDGRPADLGYFVGRQICSAFYDRQQDKQVAVASLLRATDPTKLLQRSGYGP